MASSAESEIEEEEEEEDVSVPPPPPPPSRSGGVSAAENDDDDDVGGFDDTDDDDNGGEREVPEDDDDEDAAATTAPRPPPRKKLRQSAAAPPSSSSRLRRNGDDKKKKVRVSSVVKLFVKKVHAVQTGPWKMSSETSCTGTGFVLPNRRILTVAHVVHRGRSILCRAQSGPTAPTKFECQIESVSLPLDLAVLTVNDERFFEDKPSAKLVEGGYENLPNLDDNVTAVGFPTGGDQISVTRGVVSRITHNGEVLRVQIDAAINPGNSGGPVFDERGRVVGVACSHLKNASNVGYVIPAMIVRMFFASTEDTGGRCNAAMRTETNPEGYCGVACLGITKIQTLENPTLRKYLGMSDREGGVRVVSVDPLGGCNDETFDRPRVEPDDVLLEVNGTPIGRDGTVPLPGRPEERIFFSVVVSSDLARKPASIALLRNGSVVRRSVTPAPRRFVCPRIDGYDAPDPPPYLVCGGLVFVTLTKPWLRAASAAGKRKCSHLLSCYGGPLAEEGRQIVVLSSVLACSANVGYHGLSGLVLGTVNGAEVFSLRHLATLARDSKGPLLEFRFTQGPPPSTPAAATATDADKVGRTPAASAAADVATPPRRVRPEDEVLVVLDREECKKADPEIRKAHMIASPCSPGIDFDWA